MQSVVGTRFVQCSCICCRVPTIYTPPPPSLFVASVLQAMKSKGGHTLQNYFLFFGAVWLRLALGFAFGCWAAPSREKEKRRNWNYDSGILIPRSPQSFSFLHHAGLHNAFPWCCVFVGTHHPYWLLSCSIYRASSCDVSHVKTIWAAILVYSWMET